MRPTEKQRQWADAWLDAVADGKATMSQRKASSVELRGGGRLAVSELARAKGVHHRRIDRREGKSPCCSQQASLQRSLLSNKTIPMSITRRLGLTIGILILVLVAGVLIAEGLGWPFLVPLLQRKMALGVATQRRIGWTG